MEGNNTPMKPRILILIPLCDYERWSSLHALTSIAAMDAGDFDIEVLVHVQTELPCWEELEELYRTYPFSLVVEYWWKGDIPVGGDPEKEDVRLHGITYSRNHGLRIARDCGYDGLWYIDSDVLVPASALQSLWLLNKPLVSGVFYGHAGKVPYVFCKDFGRANDMQADTNYDCHYIRWLPKKGTITADFTGNGCLLWRGEALQSDLWYDFGFREQENHVWAEDPYTLLEALDRGIGPVVVECGIVCWHTNPDQYAYADGRRVDTAGLLREMVSRWKKQHPFMTGPTSTV
jgi:hypothetical protein